MGKGDKGTCPTCGAVCAVSSEGTLRRHPRGAEEPCAGSGYAVRAPDWAETRPVTATPAPSPSPRRRNAKARPGIYRSTEPMLEPGTPCPPGHAIVALIAYVPYDPTGERTPQEEAALLFEDPAHLYRTLDATPNTHVRLSMKIERP